MIKVGEYIEYFQPEIYEMIVADYRFSKLYEILSRCLNLMNNLLKRGLVYAKK